MMIPTTSKINLRRCKIRFTGWWLALLLILPQLTACSTYRSAYSLYGADDRGVVANGSYQVNGKRYSVVRTAQGYDKTGYASWYGGRFSGRRTSSHETYNMYAMTAASRDLPIPSYAQVTNLRNGHSVVVKINDRGPFRSSRIIDLSYAAAQQLGFTRSGTTMVRVTGLSAHEASPSYALNSERLPLSSQAKNTTHYLQVGAYKSRQAALNASKQIAALTQQDVAVKTVYHHNRKVYNVHVGPLASGGDSAKITQLLMQNGYQKPISVE